MKNFFALLIKIWDFLVRNKKWVFVFGLFLLIITVFKQCDNIRDLKKEAKEQENVMNQNLMAYNDMNYQFKLTKDQLKLANQDLYSATLQVESLLVENKKKPGVVIKEIYKTKIEYRDTTIIVDNSVAYNDSTNLYNVAFSTKDLVRSFEVNNYVRLLRDSVAGCLLLKDHSEVKNFKFEFDIIFAKYQENGYTKIKAYAVNNETNQPIPDNILRLSYRGAELLDKPWELNKPKPKRWAHGIGVSINPIGVVPVLQNGKITPVYAPSVSIGYYFGINWNK